MTRSEGLKRNTLLTDEVFIQQDHTSHVSDLMYFEC